MRATVQKWGNSLAVRIPKAFAEETKLKQGVEVEMSLSEGSVVIIPINTRERRLSELLDKVTQDNLHQEIDWGRPRGRESL